MLLRQIVSGFKSSSLIAPLVVPVTVSAVQETSADAIDRLVVDAKALTFAVRFRTREVFSATR